MASFNALATPGLSSAELRAVCYVLGELRGEHWRAIPGAMRSDIARALSEAGNGLARFSHGIYSTKELHASFAAGFFFAYADKILSSPVPSAEEKERAKALILAAERL